MRSPGCGWWEQALGANLHIVAAPMAPTCGGGQDGFPGFRCKPTMARKKPRPQFHVFEQKWKYITLEWTIADLV